MSNEPWRLGAADLAAAIRSKKLSSREVVQSHLDRIAAVNPKLNAVTVTLAESALAAADAADHAVAAGGTLGPLHGVPFTVKENIDLAGSATTQGIVAMAEAVPPVDAPHIAQIRIAGAIPIGRTNLPDFGLRWHTDNELRGATKNPWDATRTPGGSSGGEAAALATGMSPLGIGNDLGGSLRWPSQCNGTAALKPTLGRIPDHSALAPADAPPSFQLMAVQGPMARHVRDLRLAFANMTGPDARDPWWTPAPLQGPPAAKRVAVTFDPAGMGVDPRVAAGVRRAADALKAAGYQVDEVDPPMVAEALECWTGLVLTETAVGFMPILQQIGGKDANTFLNNTLALRPAADSLAAYSSLFAERVTIARAWAQFFELYPVVLGPVSCGQPFAVGEDLAPEGGLAIRDHLRLVVALNLLGLPAAVVNAGVDGGLPQGVQLIADRYREDLCLDAAEAVETALGIATPIDPR